MCAYSVFEGLQHDEVLNSDAESIGRGWAGVGSREGKAERLVERDMVGIYLYVDMDDNYLGIGCCNTGMVLTMVRVVVEMN